MKNCIGSILILTALGSQGQQIIQGAIPKDEIVYACAPCGCAHDDVHFDSMGSCPSCNMSLQASFPAFELPARPSRRLTAGMLLFEHADIMDVTGPWSVMVHNGVEVVSFAKTKDPVTIGMSMELKPDFTFDNLPDVDILIFPGSGLAESNPGDAAIQAFIKERAASTEVLFSVCSGAFFLAESGLLDGKDATTFASLIPQLRENYPSINVLDHVKYTDNGKIVTTAGLSSGIDGAFHVVSKFRGQGSVQDVANHMEYAWNKSTDYARTQLADQFIVGIKNVASLFADTYLHSGGDLNHWEYRYSISPEIAGDKVLRIIKKELMKKEWTILEEREKSLVGILDHSVLGQGKIEVELESSEVGEVLIIVATRVEKYKIVKHD